MEKELWKGNEAIAEAAIRAGCKYFFGYPITPQNEIPEYLSAHLPKVSILAGRHGRSGRRCNDIARQGGQRTTNDQPPHGAQHSSSAVIHTPLLVRK